MSDTSTPGASDPSGGDVEGRPGGGGEPRIPPEALAPSGRSEESLPETAPNPARRDMEQDPEDGSTEIPPVTPDA